ncbi:MAG: hypothetical protein V7K94_11965 [Nostoc sp.]|uniref:hypothetical protein n=1 Tax=Nostoc sp. TaxID=1180 RepID=UPI002FF492BB
MVTTICFFNAETDASPRLAVLVKLVGAIANMRAATIQRCRITIKFRQLYTIPPWEYADIFIPKDLLTKFTLF